MKVSYEWLQTYFDDALPSPQELGELLTFHAFEIEGIEQMRKDHVIDVDVLPNRASDCLCHRGIARELATLLGRKLRDDPLLKDVLNAPVSKLLTVEVLSPELCSRFSALTLSGVKVGPSPKWLVERLRSIGQKSINNVVDAVNYVMFDIGQPLHAFDRDKLTEKDGSYNITVRTGKGDEKIVTLDGGEYTLGKENLLIVDGNNDKPIGIAGVKGGKRAAVDEDTTHLIIEAANFNYVSVRKTSQKLKLNTDASSRFQNESSPELTLHALREVGRILEDIGAGGKLEGYVDVYPKQKKPYKVGISLSEVNKLLGTRMSEKEVESIFERFGFSYEKVSPCERVLEVAKTLEGKAYKYGASISYDAPKEFDCSSFTAYVFAQAGIAIPRMSVDQFVFGDEVKEKELQPGDLIFSVGKDKSKIHQESVEFLKGTKVKGGVSHCGIYLGKGEIIHASGEDSKGTVVIEQLAKSADFKNIVGYRRMLLGDEERFVVTASFERKDLKIKEDLIEEVGRVYGYKNIKSEPLPKAVKKPNVNKHFYYEEIVRSTLVQHGFSEVMTYVLRDKGEVEIENPLTVDKSFLRSTLVEGFVSAMETNTYNTPLLGLDEINIFEIGHVFKKEKEELWLGLASPEDMTKLLESLFVELGLNKPTFLSRKGTDGDILLQEEKIGSYGRVGILGEEMTSPSSKKRSFAFSWIQINLDELMESFPESPDSYEPFEKSKGVVSYKPISQYPFVLRDISVWVPETVKSEEVVGLIREEAGNVLVNSQLFDEYKKDGKVSYAFNLVFQSQEKTLSDDEVNKVMKKITATLGERDGWEVR